MLLVKNRRGKINETESDKGLKECCLSRLVVKSTLAVCHSQSKGNLWRTVPHSFWSRGQRDRARGSL